MSWLDTEGDGAEGEVDEGDDEEEFKNCCDRVLFLIDARENMLQRNAKGEIQIFNCLKVALEVMKTKIVAQDASSIGVTFFGSREKDSSEGAEGVFTLLPLAPPSAARIRQLQSLLNDKEEFGRLIGSQSVDKKSCPLKQALWACSQAFATKDLKKTDFKRVWLFTNDDKPNAGFPVEQKATITVARDCSQAGIEISLWHLNRDGQPFDPKAYYFQLLVATGGNGEDDVESAIDSRMLGAGFDGFDSLLDSVRRKAYRKRRLCSTLFSLDPRTGQADSPHSTHMGVQIFNAIQVAKKPLHTWLYAATNQPTRSVSRYFQESTGEILSAEQMDTYIDVAGSKVSITKEEVDELKFLGNVPGVGVRLVSFSPQDQVPLDFNIASPYLLYPHEKAVRGSALMFEALLRSCAAKKVVPVVRFNRVDRAMPRLAVLWPQLEEVDEDGCQVTPPAFHLIPMPFADDIRFCPFPKSEPVEVPPEAAAAAADLVSALAESMPDRFRYEKDIESPALQQFYTVLQAVALNSDTLEWQKERDDNMRLSAEGVAKCSGPALALREALGAGEFCMEDAKPRKRTFVKEEGEVALAKKRKEALEGDFTRENIKLWTDNQKLATFTVAKLKEMCKVLKVAVSGAKADLVERIEESFLDP